MIGYSVKRADLCEAGRKGWACVDSNGAPVEYFEEYKHAAERAKLENDTARKPRKPRADQSIRDARKLRRYLGSASPSTVGNCDGLNFDNLGESPDY
jgi:hypothetical protein